MSLLLHMVRVIYRVATCSFHKTVAMKASITYIQNPLWWTHNDGHSCSLRTTKSTLNSSIVSYRTT